MCARLGADAGPDLASVLDDHERTAAHDEPSTLTLYLSTFSDVVGSAANPTRFDRDDGRNVARIVLTTRPNSSGNGRPIGVSTACSPRSTLTWSACQHDRSVPAGPTANAGMQAKETTFERHYSVDELASTWGVSDDFVRRLFLHEPGVVVFFKYRPGRWTYRAMRIPESVARRVHRRMELEAATVKRAASN